MSYYYEKEELGGVESPIFKRRKKQITDWESLEEEMRGALDYNALSDDQREVFDKVMKWYDNRGELLTLGGYAGTGKSTLISIIARELEGATKQEFQVAFCAYTGKAANVLKQKLRHAGIQVSPQGYPHYAGTIHSLIYKPIQSDSGAVLDWELKEDSELQQYSLIVVDEASMVDEKVLEDVPTRGLSLFLSRDAGNVCAKTRSRCRGRVSARVLPWRTCSIRGSRSLRRRRTAVSSRRLWKAP
jgi:tRNA(Met) C34 N-acetyltransferase TmcA